MWRAKLKVAMCALLMLAVLLVPGMAKADVNDFTVNDFSADYTLSNADRQGSMHVIEHLQVTFTDNNHGILRAIPESYKGQSLKLHINRVTSTSGAPSQFTTYKQNGNTVLKIGDPNRTVTGNQEYTIDYSLENVIIFYGDHDELYWDVNGDQWQQPFTHVKATLRLPKGLAISKHGVACFTGKYGSTSYECTVSSSDASTLSFETKGQLAANQTLTLVTGFNRGFFMPATLKDKVADYWLSAAAVVVPILLLGGGAYRYWRRLGKDAKGKKTIIPQYSPPKDVSLLEAGAIMDFRVDNRDITATIIDLALRKYLKIIEKKQDRLFGDTFSYSLELQQVDFTGLMPHEQKLMKGLFPNALVGQTADLTTAAKLYKITQDMVKDTEQQLADQGYFRANPLKVGKPLVVVMTIVAILSSFILFVQNTITIHLFIGVMIGTVIMLLFAMFMPARTSKGVETKEHLQGLKMYMEIAEKDRIAKMQSPNAPYAEQTAEPVKTVALFEKLLPYAILLGVEKQWAKQFESLYTQPPEWYAGNWSSFNSSMLANNLSSGFNTAVISSFTPPSSSGGSGFSGGGAGGGGGGGGGGGW